MPGRALLLVNPRARRGREAYAEIAPRLQSLGLHVVQESIEKLDDMPNWVERYRPDIDRVVVAGGDGTLNTVIQGIAGTDLTLAIVPLGTANNSARTLGIPLLLPEACHLAVHGLRRWIDLGCVNGRFFLTTASIGLSVDIAGELDAGTKRRWGPLAYGVTALRLLTRSRPFHADIAWNGQVRRSRTVQIVVGNGRYYGTALPVAEDATIDDARLDLYSLEVRHWWELLALAPALRRGRHGEKRSVETLRANAFEIRTRIPRPINIDGEIRGETPARFKVVPRALEVFAPSEVQG
jgi:diacylglycerol kinase (ATP)